MNYTIANLGPTPSADLVEDRYRLRSGAWSVANTRPNPKKRGVAQPVRRYEGQPDEALPYATGHTSAGAVEIDGDGTVYGWSVKRISGRARRHAVVWEVGRIIGEVEMMETRE